MNFGKVSLTQLPGVDFTLPPDTDLTRAVLNGGQVKPEIYAGCAKWGRKEWVGMIYPQETTEANFLDEYLKQFNSIELNAVFYKMPPKEQIRSWKQKAESARDDFKFFPKITRSISHIKRLKNADEATATYLENIYEFGGTLGPCFLQMSDNFGPRNFQILQAYLESLPRDFDLFVEVRHRDWYSDREARKELFGLLYDLKKGAVITDTSGRRDCLHMELPTPHAFVRFVGNGVHEIDFKRIDAWMVRLKQWQDKGLKAIYFFLHQHDEKDTPILADYTIRKLNEVVGSTITPPQFLKKAAQFEN